MAELDKLEIVVTADTSKAESSISSLLEKLEQLQQKLSGLSGGGVGKKINGISSALNSKGLTRTLQRVGAQAEKTAKSVAKAASPTKMSREEIAAARERLRALQEQTDARRGLFKDRILSSRRNMTYREKGESFMTRSVKADFAYRRGIAEDERVRELSRQMIAQRNPLPEIPKPDGSQAAEENAKAAQSAMDLADKMQQAGASAKEMAAAVREAGAASAQSGNDIRGVVEIAKSGDSGSGGFFSNLDASISSVLNQMPGFTSVLASALPVLSSLASAAGRLAMTGLGKFFQASISPIVSFGKRIQGVTSGVMGLFKQFKRLALLRLFRTAIAEIGKGLSTGINNLYQYSSAINGSFKSALDSAATSMQYFRNSIGAAAAPLIQTFIPYLNAAVNAIVTFINIINQLLAALGGAFSFTRAKKSLTEFGKAAGGAGGGAGKAAKEMDKFLASWDEITNIKTPNDSGGGGGGGGGAGEFLDMFEEAAIDPELLDFASRIREAFEAGRWEEVGKIIADKLNEIMPDDATFENWGRRFGEKINMAFGIALGFLRNFNFKALGSRIASFLNGGIDEVNWNNIGAYLWRRLSSAFDIAIGFISTFDTKGATTAISNLLIGMWNETTAWLGETDWSEFGRTVAGKLLDAIAGIKWIELITSAWELAKAAISATWDFFSGFVTGLFSRLWEDIKAGLAETEIGKAFTEWWDQVQAVWGPVAEWFNTNVIGPVKEFFAPLGEAITGFLKDPIGTIQQAWTEEVEWWSTNVIEPIKMKFAPIKEAIEGFLNDPIGTIQLAWMTFAEWFNTTFITPVVNYFNSLKANIELAFEAAKQFVMDAWLTVSEWFSTNVTTPINDVFSPLEGAITGFLSNPVGAIKQAWIDIKSWFARNIINPISSSFSNLGNTIKQAFFGAINNVIGGLNSFIGHVNSIGMDFGGGYVGPFYIEAFSFHPFSLPSIPTLEYAEGGFPTEGEMFIAREAGPELVGRMGNRSAVANNDQIVEGIRQGVYEAMVAANNGQNSREVKVYIDGKDITDYTRKRSNQMARALGV